MSDYPEIAARFARETKHHEMTTLLDQGLYRHIKFTNPEHGSFYRFDLITWPHNLVMRGDGMSFGFSIYPTEDWFDVVRRTSWPGEINPGYWAEKVTAGREATEGYSEELFKQEVAADLKAAEPSYPGVTEAWTKHVGEMSEYNTEYEEEARRALDEFTFGIKYKADCSECGDNDSFDSRLEAVGWAVRHRRENGEKRVASTEETGFYFSDTWEWHLKDFTWQYLFACHALRWGVEQYAKVQHYGLKALAVPQPTSEAVAA